MVRSEVRDQRSEIRDQRSEGKKFIFWVFSGKDVDCLSWNPAFYQFLDFGKLNPDVILRICIRSLSQNPMQCWFRCFHHRRPEVRDQRSEIRGQRSEVRDQRSEIRGQRSEVRDQRSEIRREKVYFLGFFRKGCGLFIMEPNIRPTSLFIEINFLCVSLSIY